MSKVANYLKMVQAVSVIGGIVFTCYQVHYMAKTYSAAEKVNSANFVLKISDELGKDEYTKIMYALDDHDGSFKIRGPKSQKKFSDHHIEDYIGNFETLGNLADDSVVVEPMVYNELGYEIEKAWCNRDVYNLVQEMRKKDGARSGPNAFYCGFERLAAYSLNRDGKSCADMDKE